MSELAERLRELGARFTEVAGGRVPRTFGDAGAEYDAVRHASGIALRSDLAPLRMWGRDPARMLHGLVTNDLLGAGEGEGRYAAMLTPKGRMIAELRALRTASEPPEVLVIVPREALAGTAEHLKKMVPPMFARWTDASDELGILGVYGPRAAEIVAAVLGCGVPEGEDAFTMGSFEEAPVTVVATREAGGEAGFDLVAPMPTLPPLWEALLEVGQPLDARPVGFAALETLRIEAGRPRYGAELTEQTIPTEAYEPIGWMERAISFTKGCYTGQEVIVRIAHRGHVNRLLRGILLGDAPTPTLRTPLVNPSTGREIGWTASAAVSPGRGQTVALAYVRREIEPGAEIRLGSPDGPPAHVVALPFIVSPGD
jgi:folate-binding protein YgfZ